MDVPETRYAKTADGAYIAYKVAGEGSTDIVYIPGWNSRLDLSWEQPLDARFVRSLASFSRLIMLDRRGSGLSDSVSHHAPPPLEVLVDDIKSVLDAVGSEKATVFGEFEGGPHCALFAATYPTRTRALILYATYARGAWAPDYPWAWTDQEMEEDIASGERALQSGRDDEEYYTGWVEQLVPSLADDASLKPWLRKLFGVSGNPGSQIALVRFDHSIDVRAVLPTIRVPTLVMNRVGDRMADLDEGRWLAAQIPDATFLELPGEDHPPWAGDQGSILEAVSAFLGVSRQPAEVDRVLATVLFTDIVDSTQKAIELGDAGWRDLLATHEERAKAEIARYAGTFVDAAGDGVFATFAGPARAVRCALAIGASLRDIELEIRAGCHTGEVELAQNRVRGIAVHIGARVAALAEPSQVLVSSTVKDLVAGSGLSFEDAGEHLLKGVPERWHLYRVVG
jgi:class 3 adenylate cyclase